MHGHTNVKIHTLGYVKVLGAESNGTILSRQRQMDRPKIHTV
jgi:hypothetical protein